MKKYFLTACLIFLLASSGFSQLSLSYQSADNNSISNQIKPCLNLTNTGSDFIDLEQITLRYYYTRESNSPQEFSVDYAAIGTDKITGQYIDSANSPYMEISLLPGAGNLAAGKSTGEIQIRINNSDWTIYDQSNDYSFIPQNEYGDNFYIAVYLDGVLVAGVEPAAEIETEYRLNLTISEDIPVSITLDPPGGKYSQGTEVIITAQENYKDPISKCLFDFYEWQGDIASYDNRLTIVMDSDKNIEARYVPLCPSIGPYELNVDSPHEYTLDPPGPVYEYPRSVTISALNSYESPDGGVDQFSHFVIQGENMNIYENPYTLNVDRSINIDVVYLHGDPTPPPTPTPYLGKTLDFYFSEDSITAGPGDRFAVDVYANIPETLGVWNLFVDYDLAKLDYSGYKSESGKVTEHFIDNGYGRILLADCNEGYYPGPGIHKHFFTLYFVMRAGDASSITLESRGLFNLAGNEMIPRVTGVMDRVTIYNNDPSVTTMPTPPLFVVTPEPFSGTPCPTPVGNFIWSRELTILNSANLKPVSKAFIKAKGLTENYSRSDDNGKAYIEVYGHDTNRVRLNIQADNFKPFSDDLIGLPIHDEVTLYLEPTDPGLSLSPRSQTLYYNQNGSTKVVTSNGNWSVISHSPILSVSPMSGSPGESIVITPDWAALTQGSTVSAELVLADASGELNYPVTLIAAASMELNSVWMEPVNVKARVQSPFEVEIHGNTGTQKLAAYGFNLVWPSPSVGGPAFYVDTNIGTRGVEPGPDGFVSAVNSSINGKVSITGFDINGKGPGNDLHICTVHFRAGHGATSATLDLIVDKFTNLEAESIVLTNYNNSITITVTDFIMGDVNESGKSDIIDALLTAQYYVGLDPVGFDPYPADVNCDSSVDIVDAMLMAQYYVGVISDWPCILN